MRVAANPSPVEHRMPLCPRRRRQVFTGLARGHPLHDNICGARRRASLPLNDRHQDARDGLPRQPSTSGPATSPFTRQYTLILRQRSRRSRVGHEPNQMIDLLLDFATVIKGA